MIVTPGNEDLHRYTKNRFVWDEAYEMAQRHVSFNVEALASIAADALGSSRCVSAEKLPDGNHNKALLLTMDNGMQAVAKIPNPNAGRPHLTIASEVATMDFVCISESLSKRFVDMTRYALSSKSQCQRSTLGARMQSKALSELNT